MFVKVEKIAKDKDGNFPVVSTAFVECSRHHLHIQPDVSKFTIVCVNEDGKIIYEGGWADEWRHRIHIMNNHGEIIDMHTWGMLEEHSSESSSFEERGLSARRQSAKLKMKGMKEMKEE